MNNTIVLINTWNKIFNSDILESEINENYINNMQLFNSFLNKLNNSIQYKYIDSICLCKKIGMKYIVTYYDNYTIQSKSFGNNTKRKMYTFLESFNWIIISGFAINNETLSNKIIMREEIIINFLGNNETHFYSKDLLFSKNDDNVYLTQNFYNLIYKNKKLFNLILFGSFLLNSFELGFTVDEVTLTPKITLSKYGRWYWTNTEKVQNDSEVRQKIYKKLLKYGSILSADFVSAEPYILSDLIKSKLLKKVIKQRIKLKIIGDEDSNALKLVINSFIHSNDSPDKALYKFNIQYPNSKISKKIGMEMSDFFDSLHQSLICYNSIMMENYRNEIVVEELYRRIIIPDAVLYSDNDLIKEHRKYLQGHTHDKLLKLAELVHTALDILPIFTVHDSASFFINHKNKEDILCSFQNCIKELKSPIEIEIIS